MNNQNRDQVRQQIAQANNILVAVSSNPSVDELAASVGLTLALNKLDKHATTVFSGKVPSTIEFLQPEQTIETTTDSLRDFIIALDKSKADKLRYKVEDNVVRIFITPYRTSITQADLNFTQGDFNVDLVLAIGVDRREDLDSAITAHGRILHDATVISMSNKQETSELGSIHWQEPSASSLSEMVSMVVSELQQNILDGQMATAFLTGIVAETDRFKNQRTTPLTLSISSQLMTAGANQQLIAEKLEPVAPVQPIPEFQPAPGIADIPYDELANSQQSQDTPAQNVDANVHPAYAHNGTEPNDQPAPDGSISINHSDEEEVKDIHIDEHGTLQPKPAESSMDNSPTQVADILQSPAQDTSEPSEDYDSGKGYLSPNNAPKETADNGGSEDPSLAQPKTETPMMRHERVIAPSEDSSLVADKVHSDKPFDLKEAVETPGIVQQYQPSAPASPPESPMPTPASPSPAPSQTQTPPAGDTLADLEQSVGSPHVSSVPPSESAQPSIAELTKKAANAADAVAPIFPTPQEALGSAPLDVIQQSVPMPPPPPTQEPPKEPEQKSEDNPPPVPPPMAPQFFDANGDSQKLF